MPLTSGISVLGGDHVARLREQGVEIPVGAEVPSRQPTPHDMRRALAALGTYRVNYFVCPDEWQASIENPQAASEFLTITTMEFAGDEDQPVDYIIEGYAMCCCCVLPRS